MSHSKRNTSLAFFTAHERSQLRSTWGSQSTRLTRDSFLPFGSCTLCLQTSVDPVACNGGPVPPQNNATDNTSQNKKRTFSDFALDSAETECHIFCRECAMASLLGQKKEIKRLEREREAMSAEQAEVKALLDEETRVRAVEDFERVQMGLEPKHNQSEENKETTDGASGKQEATPVRLITANGESQRRNTKDGASTDLEEDKQDSGKRSFDLSPTTLTCTAAQDQNRAAQALQSDRDAEARTKHLPSFWIPSLTPSSSSAKPLSSSITNLTQNTPICPASTPKTAHPVSLKTLIPVHFSTITAAEGAKADTNTRTCPACTKPLTNASHATMAKPCGHVLCGPCTSKFVLDEGGRADEGGVVGVVVCYVCSADLTERPRRGKDGGKDGGKKEMEKIRPGLVRVAAEGTGFAGGGRNVVSKVGTAFQC